MDTREIILDYEQSIAFIRGKDKKLYNLDMKNFQEKSDSEMNYFRTELMRYFVHNYNKMSEVQRNSILQQIPFNTHFNWDFNLISVLSCMGNKS